MPRTTVQGTAMERPRLPLVSTVAGVGVSEPEEAILTHLQPPGSRVLVNTLLNKLPNLTYARIYRWLLILKKKGIVKRTVTREMVMLTPTKRVYWETTIHVDTQPK